MRVPVFRCGKRELLFSLYTGVYEKNTQQDAWPLEDIQAQTAETKVLPSFADDVIKNHIFTFPAMIENGRMDLLLSTAHITSLLAQPLVYFKLNICKYIKYVYLKMRFKLVK